MILWALVIKNMNHNEWINALLCVTHLIAYFINYYYVLFQEGGFIWKHTFYSNFEHGILFLCRCPFMCTISKILKIMCIKLLAYWVALCSINYDIIHTHFELYCVYSNAIMNQFARFTMHDTLIYYKYFLQWLTHFWVYR